MNQLVFMQDNMVATSSRVVAEYFGMEHKTVLRALDNKKSTAENSATINSMFFESTYIHEQNKQEYREVIMTPEGASFLVTGFTGKKAHKLGDFLKSLDLDCIHIHTQSRFSESFEVELLNAMNYLEVECLPEYRVGSYRIDWYLPEYNIAIEYDENHHLHESNVLKDKLRQEMIHGELGCKFIRLDYRERDSMNLVHVVTEVIKRRGFYNL